MKTAHTADRDEHDDLADEAIAAADKSAADKIAADNSDADKTDADKAAENGVTASTASDLKERVVLELPPEPDDDAVEDDAVEDDEPVAKPVSALPVESLSEPAAPSQPVPVKKAGKWRRRLMRSLLALVAVGAVVAGVVFGWPVLNDRVLQPVADNSQDTAVVQGELATALDRVSALESELGQLDERVTSLATARDEDLASITDQIDAVTGRIDDVDSQLVDLTTADSTAETAAAVLGDRLGEVKAMELLSRARLFLYQANYGLAAQDVAAARAILGDIENDDPMRLLAVERLGVVLVALPDRPVAASADLDIAWQALLGDVPTTVPLAPVETPATSATSISGSSSTSTTVATTTTTGP